MKARVGLYIALNGLLTNIICTTLVEHVLSPIYDSNSPFSALAFMGCILFDVAGAGGLVAMVAGLLLAVVVALWNWLRPASAGPPHSPASLPRS